VLILGGLCELRYIPTVPLPDRPDTTAAPLEEGHWGRGECSGGGGGVALGGADRAGGEGGGSSSSSSRMTPDRSTCSICIVACGPAVEFRRGGHCPLSAKVREFVQVLHVTTDRDGLLEETLRALPVVALEH
jgi:hypothetical protein